MELLNTLGITNNKSFSLTSPLTPRFPTKTSYDKNPLRYYAYDSIHYKNSLSICSSRGRKFIVLAHFSRTTIRRNSLRKKLIDEQQVRFPLNPNSDMQYIDRNFRDTESFREKTNRDTGKDSNFSIGFGDDSAAEESGGKEPKINPLGESVMLTKLENWVQQYKKDTEYWGIGSASIFTVFQNSDGNVKRVSVNVEEILKRARVEQQEAGALEEVNLKILHAKRLAKEMESGKNVIPRNSSVAKFVIQSNESGFLKAIQGFQLQPQMLRELPKVGSMILCGFIALWALKKIFANGNKEEHTEPGKEMMRMKIESRNDKERVENGTVEVVQEPIESLMISVMKPKLDRKELMNCIKKANAVTGTVTVPESSTSTVSKSTEFDEKVQEIRKMATQAREIECKEHCTEKRNGVDGEEIQTRKEEGEEQRKEEPMFLTDPSRSEDAQALSITNMEISAIKETPTVDKNTNSGIVCCADDIPLGESSDYGENSVRIAPRIIRTVKEAREYLSEKRYKQESCITSQVKAVPEADLLIDLQSSKQNDNNRSQELNSETYGVLNGKSEPPPVINGFGDSIVIDEEFIADKNHELKSFQGEENDVEKQQIFLGKEVSENETEKGLPHAQKNWMEKNFGEFEPVIKKIGSGFKDNYMVAREKESGSPSLNSNMTELGFIGDDSELDWMEDDNLREIVFQVQENEMAGREPFYMMDEDDKIAFFKGLEKKVERENAKLLELHEFLHSNIENLDYGTDGISIYDPPEKIIPRWKGPLFEKSPEFLDDFLHQRKAIFGGDAGISLAEKDGHKFLQGSMQSSTNENVATSPANGPVKKLQGDPKKSKTIIESSDGSVRAGKKSGKEFWQHTKKWSQEFLECYNAETDPEVKSDMKDIGKDLDRWITEKEIKEAADYMEKMPERNKEFMEKKLKKLKREMELFGPQAVVSKYREYSEAKEEDHLWWLDLPHLLCIEMYTCNDEQQRIGFYSLEMAGDLEVEPKPVHVIAFENSNDCKNLCYIIQAHLEMLGSGHAFVVPRPPKDAYREAKANGFSVTVLRKGELQLNVDQTLEEVEEQIVEIGSKMYHDMIMREQSVDASSIMKGVFGLDRKILGRKRTKRMRKKASKKLR